MSQHCRDDVCITCSDQLLSMRVEQVSVDGTTAQARSEVDVQEIAVDLIEAVRPGDVVLVHGGVALQRAPTERAR